MTFLVLWKPLAFLDIRYLTFIVEEITQLWIDSSYQAEKWCLWRPLLIQTSLHHTHQTNQDNVLFADFIFNRKIKSYLTHRASHIWTISNESIYDYDIKDIIIILYSNCNHCNFVQPDFLHSCSWSNSISEGIQKRWQNWPYISPWVPLWITR